MRRWETWGRRALFALVASSLLIGLHLVERSPSPEAVVPVRVMPLGDSITYGYPDTSGYRVGLAQLASQAGESIDFVGTLQHGPPELADKDHEGHGGWRIDQLTPNIASWMASGRPDIVLLHIGTNDVAENHEMAQAPARLQALLESICRNGPGVRLVVASIGARDNRWDVLTDFNAAIPGVVETVRSSGCNARFLDMNKALVQADLPDGAHPNKTGYDKIANSWFPVLRSAYAELRQHGEV